MRNFILIWAAIVSGMNLVGLLELPTEVSIGIFVLVILAILSDRNFTRGRRSNGEQ